MILEGIVTTISPTGEVNIAPMGPRVDADMRRFLLRPFNTSQTYRNLRAHGEGVLHVTDDALMIARAAIGLDPQAESRPAGLVRGRVLVGACRYHEFRVVEIDAREDRASLSCESVASGVLREWFGFNRAKHAVIEAAILATRVAIVPMEDIADELRRLASPVAKTGGPDELAAFALLVEHVRRAAHSIGRTDLDFPS